MKQRKRILATISAEQNKLPFAIYDENMSYDSGQGGLAIYLPTEKGYVNYNFVHTINVDRNADMWRLTVVNLHNNKGEFVKQITKDGAEWEMAVRILNRTDFIGGYAHGDEIYSSLELYIDGTLTDITSINQYKTFDEMKIVMDSIGYDPADGTTKALEHHKEYSITKDGITIDQTVTWCNNFTLCNRLGSFLAMMPPLKYSLTDSTDIITDSYYTDLNTTPINLPNNKLDNTLEDVLSVCVFGEESGIYFTMSKSNVVPILNAGNLMSLTDNSGLNYNKMYFRFAYDCPVETGDVWNATTTYNIEWK